MARSQIPALRLSLTPRESATLNLAPVRPAHRPSRREEIVKAAIAEFADGGPEGGSMSGIAIRADMTSAAVYYHFKSKDAVIDEIYAQLHDKWLTLLAAQEGETGLGLWVEGAIQRCANWMREEPEECRFLFLAGDAFGGYSRTRRREHVRRMIGHVANNLREFCPEIDRLSSIMRASALTTLIAEVARTSFQGRSRVPRTFPTTVKAAVVIGHRITQCDGFAGQVT